MSIDLKKRRRQVAWACFKPLLTEKQLLQAIRILEQHYQADSVSNLMAYVTKICAEFHIESAQSMLLYGQVREQMQQEPDTQEDPLDFVRASDGAITFSSLNATSVPSPPKQAATVSVRLLPHGVIFAHFMRQIMTDIPDQSAFCGSLRALTADPKQRLTPLTGLINRWLSNTDDYEWVNTVDEKSLASVVHLVYIGLCELSGPIEADEIFHKAIINTEQQPEARQFSPTRFL